MMKKNKMPKGKMMIGKKMKPVKKVKKTKKY